MDGNQETWSRLSHQNHSPSLLPWFVTPSGALSSQMPSCGIDTVVRTAAVGYHGTTRTAATAVGCGGARALRGTVEDPWNTTESAALTLTPRGELWPPGPRPERGAIT